MTRHAVLFFLITLSIPGFCQKKISVSESVMIGGIRQWINIKGVSDSDPVLLFLHGGPGNSAMSYAHRFTGELEKNFVVVMWDQRESGTTKKLNRSPVPLTVALFERDAVEIINYLRTRFHCSQIYLMGHSWGGFLGMTIAARHPEWLRAYIAISPMIHQVESEEMALKAMKDSAEKTNNRQEITELATVRIPFENGEELYFDRKWLAILMGQSPPPKPYVEEWSKTWLALFNEASVVNFFTEAPEIHCPIYFLLGTRDYQTHFKVTEAYYEKVKADKKGLFWFTNSAHLVNITEPAKMQDIIIHKILGKPEH